jgi:hypothetical protein
MSFKEERDAKFARGAKEHGQPWDAEHIDWRNEMRGELCDLWWYAELCPNKLLKWVIQTFCTGIWWFL